AQFLPKPRFAYFRPSGASIKTRTSNLPVDRFWKQVICFVRLYFAGEQFRKAAGAGWHIKKKLMKLTIASASDASLRVMIGSLCLIKHESYLIRHPFTFGFG